MASFARYIARQLLPKLVMALPLGKDVISVLRSYGLTYTRSNMLQDIRVLRGAQDRELTLEKWSPYQTFDPSIQVDVRLKNRQEYRAIGWLTVVDPTTGERSKRLASFYTDYLGNPLELSDTIEELFNRIEDYRSRKFESFQATALWHNLTPASPEEITEEMEE